MCFWTMFLMFASCKVIVVVIPAQTEGDTGYDYNDAYEDSYDESSGQLVIVQFTPMYTSCRTKDRTKN